MLRRLSVAKIIRRVLACCSLSLIGGCAGSFQSDAAFQRYVENLHLSDMGYVDAIGRLSRDRFTCDANGDPQLHPIPSTYCHKSWGGTKTYMIWLRPSKDDPHKTFVEASISLVVA